MTLGEHDDFYQTLRRRVAAWLEKHGKGFRHAQILLVAPDLFHLLCKLIMDKRVPGAQKARLAAAVVYFVSPLDFMPEGLLGPVGYLDDVAVAAYVISGLLNAGHGALAKEHWAGEGDLLSVIQQVLTVADDAIGAGLWRKIRGMLDGGG
jgi:uncharacterized membrane protein YkvA (DUF1232 family)